MQKPSLTLLNISTNKWYWLGLFILGVSLEANALFYQYVLDYPPCVLCIHVRIWALAMITVSLLALPLYKNWFGLFTMNALMTVIAVGLVERSYLLLGTERGFVFGDCSMQSGLPAWFALDEWIPSVFKIWEPCGYTPELLFGITMAEALIVLSSLLLFISSICTVSPLINRYFYKVT
jgi:disulfide bond formation protein DsbB